MSEEETKKEERAVAIRSLGPIAAGSTGHLVLQPDRDGRLVDIEVESGAEISMVFAGKGTRFSAQAGRAWRDILATAEAPVRVRQGGYLTVVVQNVSGEDRVLSGRVLVADEAEPRAEAASEFTLPPTEESSEGAAVTRVRAAAVDDAPGKRRPMFEGEDAPTAVSQARAEQLLRVQVAPRPGEGVVGFLRMHAEAIRTWLENRIPVPRWIRTTVAVMIDASLSTTAQPEGENEVVVSLDLADARVLRDGVMFGALELDPAVAVRVLRAVRSALERGDKAASEPTGMPALPAGPDVITVEAQAST